MAKRRGRSRKSGARHPSGDLVRDGGDPRAINCFQRIIKLGIGQGLENPLGRYLADQRITDLEWEGGQHVRRTFHRWHRAAGLRAVPQSAVLEVTRGGGGEPEDDDCQRARKAWQRLSDLLKSSPAGEAVYTLCVLERVVPWQALPEVKALLATIGRRLRHGRDADEGRAAKGATPRTGRAT